MNVEEIRRDFPLLRTGIIYLDSASSSLTPEPVINKMLEFYREYRTNIGRSIHRLSERATQEFENARKIIQNFIGATHASEIIFTKNTTEGINLVASGMCWKRGDKVVTTLLEHHSNFIVWQRLKRFGVRLEVVKPNREGMIEIEEFERAVDKDTKLVCLTHVSNVLGTISPLKEIAEIAHEHDALVLVDAAQSVPHMKVNVRDLDCDFLAFSGHKMLGPTGVGVLYIREEHMGKIEPLCIGGGTVEDVDLEGYRLKPPPFSFEGGTPPIAEVIGLGEAVRYLSRLGMENILEHERNLTRKALDGLSELSGVEVYGTKQLEKRSGIVSFNVEGMNPHEVARLLDQLGKIAVRSGHHCAIPLHNFLGRPQGSVRASFYVYNTPEEVERFLDVLAEIVKHGQP